MYPLVLKVPFSNLIRIKFISSLSTCNNSPCSNGGTCTLGSRLDEFSCQCLPEVIALPFIDDKCNVGKSSESCFALIFLA